jgi:hypothetical protein
MAGMSTVAGHHCDGVVLSQPVVSTTAVDRVAVQDLHQAQVGQVAVDGGGGTAAVLEDRMQREFHRMPPASRMPSHTRGQLQVDAVARADVAAALRDADDGTARAVLRRDAVVHEALQVERRHVDVVGIVEPVLRAEAARHGHAPYQPAST